MGFVSFSHFEENKSMIVYPFFHFVFEIVFAVSDRFLLCILHHIHTETPKAPKAQPETQMFSSVPITKSFFNYRRWIILKFHKIENNNSFKVLVFWDDPTFRSLSYMPIHFSKTVKHLLLLYIYNKANFFL